MLERAAHLERRQEADLGRQHVAPAHRVWGGGRLPVLRNGRGLPPAMVLYPEVQHCVFLMGIAGHLREWWADDFISV